MKNNEPIEIKNYEIDLPKIEDPQAISGISNDIIKPIDYLKVDDAFSQYYEKEKPPVRIIGWRSV